MITFFNRAVEYGNISTVGYARVNGSANIVERQHQPIIVIEYESYVTIMI